MPSLDGLRALAIVLVITCHLHERMWGFLSGGVGVIIFFVLSGYLITRLALQEETSTGSLNVLGFYIRRIFRIFPLYYFILFVYVVLIFHFKIAPIKIKPFASALPYYLSYLQEIPFWTLHGTDLPFYQSWSLGIEEKFYLAWPLLMIGVTGSRLRRRIIIVVIGIVSSIGLGILPADRFPYHTESYGFIMLGVLAALMLSSARKYPAVATTALRAAPFALVLSIVIQCLWMPRISTWLPSSLYACTITILLIALVTSEGIVKSLLSSTPLVVVGKLSYGIYLVHILCLNVVEKVAKPGHGPFIGILAYVGTFVLSLAAAYALHYALEKPMISLGKRLDTAYRTNHRRTVAQT